MTPVHGKTATWHLPSPMMLHVTDKMEGSTSSTTPLVRKEFNLCYYSEGSWVRTVLTVTLSEFDWTSYG